MAPCLLTALFVCRRGKRSFAREFEGHRLADLDVGGNFDVGIGLSGERCELEIAPGAGEKFIAFGRDRDEMLQRINTLGIDVDASSVGHACRRH